MAPVPLARFLLLLLYATYLAYAGLFFLLVPWTEIWTIFVMRLPFPIAVVLGHPSTKGMLSAFGLLHFILAVFEGATGLRLKARR
ncbi:MAG: hypothetical protein DRJ65_00445 [Acidobacteria bacterium]|nr:MAG: hypothetical protein DRJ65_00445 [Acidobacteriota bacterium]